MFSRLSFEQTQANTTERESCLVFRCTAGEQMAFRCSFASFYFLFFLNTSHNAPLSAAGRRSSVCSALLSSSSRFCVVFLEADCKPANGWSGLDERGSHFLTRENNRIGVFVVAFVI